MKSSDYKKYRIERVYNILQCITYYPKMEELIDCNNLYYKTANFSNSKKKIIKFLVNL